MTIKNKITINIEAPAFSLEDGRHRIALYLRQQGFFAIAREVEEGKLNGLNEDDAGRRYYWSIIFDPRGMCIFDLEEREEFSR